MAKPYIVYVDQNDTEGEGETQYTLGEFASEAEAVAAAKGVIDDFLLRAYQPDLSAQDLFDAYAMHSEEPWIEGSDFKAWDYAIERCKEICETGGW